MKTILLLALYFISPGLIAQQPKLIQPVGHTSGINFLEYSPDNKYILTASASGDDRIARVWETHSGKLLFNLDQHVNKITRVQYSPDGRFILVLSGAPYLWDAQSGEFITLVDSVVVDDAHFSPDSKYIAYSRQQSDSVLLWNVASRRTTGFTAGKNRYEQIAFSNNGKLLFTYAYFSKESKDSSAIEVWDIKTGQRVLNYLIPTGSFRNVRFNQSDDWIAVCTSPGVFLFNLKTGELTDMEAELKEADHPLFSRDGKIFLFSLKNRVLVWDIVNRKFLHNLEVKDAWLTGLAFTPDEKNIICLDNDGYFSAWDLTSGEKKAEGQAHHGSANGLTISPDKKQYASFSYDNRVNLWRMSDFSFQKTLAGSGSGFAMVKFSPDSTHIVAVDNDSRIRITDIVTGKLLHTIDDVRGDVAELLFSFNGKRLLATTHDSALQVWDMPAGKIMYTIPATSFHFYKTAIHPSGRSFVTWEALDNKLSFWDMETGKLKTSQLIRSTGFTAHAMSFTPDGKYLLLSADGHVQVRTGVDGKLIKILQGGNTPVTAISISPDNRWVAAVADSLVFAWEIATGKKIIAGKGVIAPYYPSWFVAPSYNSVAFSPDSKKIVVSSDDATAKIFNITTRRQTMMLDSVHYLRLTGATFSPDGKEIYTVGREGFIVVWDAATGKVSRYMGSYHEDMLPPDVHPGGNYLVTAFGSALTLYDPRKAFLLYKTVFINNDDWLIVDSADRYDGTEAARKLLYFTCGNEIIELEQIKDQLWVPHLAERIMSGESPQSQTLKQLNICGLTPKVEDIRTPGGSYHFRILPRKGGLGETALLVNGIEVRRYKTGELSRSGNDYELKIDEAELNGYFVGGQDNQVSVKAFTADNTISSRGLKINENTNTQAAQRPNLYAVMVGVSDYKGEELDLRYASKDASDISNALSKAAKKLLNTDGKEHVYMYNLTTTAPRYQLPEKNSIKKLLEEIGQKATANDILLIFFAGHGIMESAAGSTSGDKKQFYFLTSEASKLTGTATIGEVGISTAELTEWMKPERIKAQKRILIFDACNSGQAIRDFVKLGNEGQQYLAARDDEKSQQVKAIEKLNERSGLFILSASASDQSAYEMGRYSQGLLTYALLKAMKQQPDILNDGKYLDLSRWFNAAEKTVSDLSKENGARQEPQIVSNTNFNIGIVDEQVMAAIILPHEKPLFAASNFQNSDEAVADDDLELSKMINLQLNDMAKRGSDSKIVYVTATNSPDAYSLSGRYVIKGNTVNVTVNIKQNKIIRSKFELSGTKDKLSELAAAVSEKAAGMVK